MERIAIIGLGLIGGSLGLALKHAALQNIEVAGFARTRGTVSKAKRAGAIDTEAHSAAHAAGGARLVVLASPIMTLPDVMREIAPALAEGAVVTDVASTKGRVARWAQELLPDHAHFIGGHPMAGKESAGFDAADASLFRGKPWVIAPSGTAAEAAVKTVVGLAQLTGAEPLFMDADEHDSYAAAVSHLPLMASAALFSMAHDSAAWPELAQMASSGFRDTTRLASGSPEMAYGIVVSNRDNVLHWIDRFREELGRLRATIASDDEKQVLETFARTQLGRDNYMVNGPPQREVAAPIETVSLLDMMVGSRVGEFMRKQESMLRDIESRTDQKRR